jgi:hypothetical protein
MSYTEIAQKLGKSEQHVIDSASVRASASSIPLTP